MAIRPERGDIRFDRSRPARIAHASARGDVVRNVGSFTRGTQLVRLQYMMAWQGIKVPLLIALACFGILLCVFLCIRMDEHEVQLVEMRIYSGLWDWVDFNPRHLINLTLPDGHIVHLPMGAVPYNPHVMLAWHKAWRCFWASCIGAAFFSVPLTIWFFSLARERGSDIMKERHERGAMLVERDVLLSEITTYNHHKLTQAVSDKHPDLDADKVALAPPARRQKLGLHVPYSIAGIPYPWDLERTHGMLIGTTGTGKTTVLLDLIAQARARGHRCVIFDLTGVFVQHFYREGQDHIINPLDTRCPPWTIFSDCRTHVDFTAAAAALIPSDGANSEPFWVMAARTLFVEMCIKLQERGETTNAAIAHRLMYASLKDIHAQLRNTVADPLTSEQASRMAESIRAVFNTNAQVLRYLPDVGAKDPARFSIRRWIREEANPGSILFITSTHTHLHVTRSLMTLWMDLAVNAQLETERNVGLKTWFLFDEVHALHRLPALEHGLQTARAYGGAFLLGIHSFERLCETYGREGATNLAALARTKLMLTAADRATAEFCSGIVGNREVREVDEAYSIGAAMSRDAATITPRTEVKPLILPDDIMNFPSLYGIIKFPEGFPAARIHLEWRAYPIIAEPFAEKKDIRFSEFKPANDDEGAGDGGRENAAPSRPTDRAEMLPEVERQQEAEAKAAADEARIDAREITSVDLQADTRSTGAPPNPAGDNPAGEESGAKPAPGAAFVEQPLRLGGPVERREREGQDKQAPLPGTMDRSKDQRSAHREQQALIDQRTGIGIVDEQDPHRHDHHHGLGSGHGHAPLHGGPALGDDSGMGM